MAVICLEGPSAVGKTTTATTLAERLEGVAIREVNALFGQPSQASPTWYNECQVERWAMAQAQVHAARIAILDGDPFQPLWYNWIYDYGFQGLEAMDRFYRKQIEAGNIAFPDRYFLLYADETTLRHRKATDIGRRRGGFGTHLRYIEPQRRYFRAMKEICPDRVEFLSQATLENTVTSILHSVWNRPLATSKETSLPLFDHLVCWLQRHSAA